MRSRQLSGTHPSRHAGVRRQRPRRHEPALSKHALELRGGRQRRNGPERHCGTCSSVPSLRDDAVEIAFIGADRGFDRGHEHAFGRSLKRDLALSDDVLLVWAMNGQPLLPQHGFPLRLIVPGWYGMASVKWLKRIEALDKPYRRLPAGRRPITTARSPMDRRTPITHMRVKSLLVPPGIPDWYTRRRLVDAGAVTLIGRAWSGGGVPIAQVEVGIDGALACRPSSIRRRASLPGAAGAASGTRSRASTSWHAAPPTPMARRSRWKRAGTPAASATMPCTACMSR